MTKTTPSDWKTARDALDMAAMQFRRYERLHRAKPDDKKADVNAGCALMCEEALAAIERIRP